LVPAGQHDLGCRDALIGGEPALKMARPDPAGESVVPWQAEPSLGQFSDRKSNAMAKRHEANYTAGHNLGQYTGM
jgi:hypothetical protein